MSSHHLQVCIVGGGPAGMVLGYLLGRCGVRTLVLESQEDFDRDFRGDTLHSGVLEIFDSIGLADHLLDLPHSKIESLSVGGAELVKFAWLRTKFPFVTMMAQSTFLDWLAREAQAFSSFELKMGASVREFVRDPHGKIIGVCYRENGSMQEVAADLVVACDGRGSRLRRKAGLEPEPMTDPLDVLWFRLSRHDDDVGLQSGALTGGRLPLVLLQRPDHYQIAAVIAPGGYAEIRAEGLPAFHERIREAAPNLFDRATESLNSWKKIAFLHVVGSRVPTWHLPGLLLIGDAAHVMTPIGGVGINYAIWDAVETANVLVPLFKAGYVPRSCDLEEIQSRREPATRLMQTLQRLAGRRILAPIARDETRRTKIPLAAKLVPRIPGLRSLLPKIIALGGKRTHCTIHDHFV